MNSVMIFTAQEFIPAQVLIIIIIAPVKAVTKEYITHIIVIKKIMIYIRPTISVPYAIKR